jgi:hypothetical protein
MGFCITNVPISDPVGVRTVPFRHCGSWPPGYTNGKGMASARVRVRRAEAFARCEIAASKRSPVIVTLPRGPRNSEGSLKPTVSAAVPAGPPSFVTLSSQVLQGNGSVIPETPQSPRLSVKFLIITARMTPRHARLILLTFVPINPAIGKHL